MPHRFDAVRDGENGCVRWSVGGEASGIGAMPRKYNNERSRDFVGQHDGGTKYLHALPDKHGGLRNIRCLLRLNPARDGVENPHALERILPDGRLPESMTQSACS